MSEGRTAAAPNPVGFVGLGAMGCPMVTQIAGRGHPVLAFDVDAERLAEVAELSEVTAVAGLADLKEAPVVVCMLPDSDAVDAVVAGPDGLLEILPPDALVIDMGSSVPRRTQQLAHAAAARGLRFADAPVSGGVARARTGELTVMFGGSDEVLALARPVLDCVATTVVPVGPVGAGHAMKALNNVLSAVGLSIACEVVEVGRRFGLDPSVMVTAVNQSTGRNHATEHKIEQYVLSETFGSGFLLRLMLKDLTTALDLAREVEAETPLSRACLELWRRGADLLPPDADQTRIAQVLTQLSGEADTSPAADKR